MSKAANAHSALTPNVTNSASITEERLMIEGRGKFTFDDGTFYEGGWIAPDHNAPKLRHGRGKYQTLEFTYEGDWSEDLMHGEGNFISASGAKYIGTFDQGTYEGQGTYYWPDGAKYQGQWVNGLMHGEGVYTTALGVTVVGTFHQGMYLKGKSLIDVRKM